MSITVVIPSKDASNLVPCLRAVHEHEPSARCIVVDDGVSKADLVDPVSWVDFVPGVKPFIFARNVNIGIREAGADDVVILNDDAILESPGGLTRMAEFAAAHADVGITAPSCNVTGQPLQWPAHRPPHGSRFVDQVPFICVFIPQTTIVRCGLLDERYCLDYGVEDRDYCETVTRAGLKIAIVYDVFVDHGSLRSTFRGDPRTPKSFARNFELFCQKWSV